MSDMAGNNNMDYSYDQEDDNDLKSRKRRRQQRESGDDGEIVGVDSDNRLMEMFFPKQFEAEFSTAVFELGLKNSSPKVLMALMPMFPNLSTEHLKSHLQKYRIHHDRSKDEFVAFYNEYMRDGFSDWESGRRWDRSTAIGNKRVKSTTSSSSSSSSSAFTSSEEATSSEKDKAMAVASLMDFDGRDHREETGGGGMLSSNDHRGSSMTTGMMSSKEALKERKKQFTGYKNIVAQASQLYNEWRSLYDTVILDTVRANSSLGMIQGGQAGLSSAKLSHDQLHLVEDTATASLLRTKSTSSRSSNGKRSRDKLSSATSIPTVGYPHPHPLTNHLFHPNGMPGHPMDGWTTSASSSSSSSYGSGKSSSDASLNCDGWAASVNNNVFMTAPTWQPGHGHLGPGHLVPGLVSGPGPGLGPTAGMLSFHGRDMHLQQLQAAGGMYAARHNGLNHDHHPHHHHDQPHINGTTMHDMNNMIHVDKMGHSAFGLSGNALGVYGNEEDANMLSMKQGRGGGGSQPTELSHSGILTHSNGTYGSTGGMTTYPHIVHNGSATEYSHSFPLTDSSAHSFASAVDGYLSTTSTRQEMGGSEMGPTGDQPSAPGIMVVSESEKSSVSLPGDQLSSMGNPSGPSGQGNHPVPTLPSYVQSSPYFTGLNTAPNGMYPSSEYDVGGGSDGVHQNGVVIPIPSVTNNNNHLMHPLLPAPGQGLGHCFYDTQEDRALEILSSSNKILMRPSR